MNWNFGSNKSESKYKILTHYKACFLQCATLGVTIFCSKPINRPKQNIINQSFSYDFKAISIANKASIQISGKDKIKESLC